MALDENKIHTLCTDTLKSIPICPTYVPIASYLDACKFDTKIVNHLSNVEREKLFPEWPADAELNVYFYILFIEF